MHTALTATIERAALVRPLNALRRVIDKQNTAPILANVLIEPSNCGLALRATDYHLEMAVWTPAAVTSYGAVTVSAHLLYEIARRLPEEADVALDSDSGLLSIRSGRSQFKLRTLSAKDFPALAKKKLTHQFTISALDLANLLNSTAFAICTDGTRYYLNGVLLHVVKVDGAQRLCAVASDGHRIAKLDCVAPDGSEKMPAIILPRKAVVEMSRLLNGSGDVKISLSDTMARFEIGSLAILTNLIEATFPDYQLAIPKSHTHKLEIDKGALVASIERIASLASARAVKLSLLHGSLRLSVDNLGSGSAEDTVEAAYSGPPFKISFNYRYLLDIMSHVEGNTACFKFTDSASPAVITGRDEDAALFVLMPMKF